MQEQENQSGDLFGDLSVDVMARQYLRSMASWAMVVVVVAVIGYVLSILDLFRTKAPGFSQAEGFEGKLAMPFGGSDVFGTFFSIAIGLLINYFLFRFARQARAGLDGFNQEQLNKSFSSLKAYFMACTIILIIVFVLVLLFIMVLSVNAIK